MRSLIDATAPDGFPANWKPTPMDEKDVADYIGVMEHSHVYFTRIQKHKMQWMANVAFKREVKTDG